MAKGGSSWTTKGAKMGKVCARSPANVFLPSVSGPDRPDS